MRGGCVPRVPATLALACLLACAVAAVQAAPAASPADVAALLDLKKAVAGPGNSLLDWSSSTDPCNATWTGVTCAAGQVVQV